MQNYNPYNPVYKFKSDKGALPDEIHDEKNQTADSSEINTLPTSYGLYVPPPLFEKGEYESVNWLQYISSTIDSKDRDYAKYPNPFNFQTSPLPEYYKNVKIFQMYYISLPQFNLMQVAIPGNADCTYMKTYLLTNTVTLNQNIVNGSNTYTICNNVNGETDFIINYNISVVYTIDSSGNFWNYGFSSTYQLNSNPYLRLQINELPSYPIQTTDQTTYSYFVRMLTTLPTMLVNTIILDTLFSIGIKLSWVFVLVLFVIVSNKFNSFKLRSQSRYINYFLY